MFTEFALVRCCDGLVIPQATGFSPYLIFFSFFYNPSPTRSIVRCLDQNDARHPPTLGCRVFPVFYFVTNRLARVTVSFAEPL